METFYRYLCRLMYLDEYIFHLTYFMFFLSFHLGDISLLGFRVIAGTTLGATLGATGATGATLCGTSLFLQYLRIFSFWDTEPGILNDALNDSSFAPPPLTLPI